MQGYGGCLLFLLVGFVTVAALSGQGHREFLQRTTVADGETFVYRVYVPKDWNRDRKWPMILFLHGAGERGDDGLLQTQVGIGPAIEREPERFPAIVVMPQCRRNRWWNDPQMETQVLQALEDSIREFNGDPTRIYLTGLSMGGYGCFFLGAKYPGRFAALVPICGGVIPPREISEQTGAGPYLETARRIGKTPVWIFHGEADRTVPVSESRRMHEALRAAGGNVRYSEYSGVGHNSWDRAYSKPDLLPWLLSQSLPSVNEQ